MYSKSNSTFAEIKTSLNKVYDRIRIPQTKEKGQELFKIIISKNISNKTILCSIISNIQEKISKLACLEKPPYFDFYYMFCLSFFISDLIGLFREDKQTDFINMLLHHVCTISLIVFSHLVHYSNVGSIVLFLHMESDVFVHVTRFFLQTDAPEIIKDINGLFLVFNFIYTRTYVLGDIIYVLYMYVTWKGVIDWFLLIFLTLIFIMNFNWALMLLQKMFALFMGTKLNDTRDFKVNTNKEKEKKVE